MAFILVIDDKEHIRTAIAMVLEDLSHAVELAE
jgi:CheY-like chemotaxis protein